MANTRDRDQRISTIINRLDSLALESRNLTQELRTLVEPTEEEDEDEGTYDHSYRIGDRVVIKNTYLQQKGTVGTVTNLTKSQVILVDNTGKIHTRKHTHVGWTDK